MTVRPSAPAKRPGFTLLEVLLASIIGVLLMAALYTAMDTHLRYAQSGRDVVDRSTLSRQILSRMAADLGASLTPINGTWVSNSSGSTSSTSTTTPTTGSTTAGTGSTMPATGSTTPTTGSSSSKVQSSIPSTSSPATASATSTGANGSVPSATSSTDAQTPFSCGLVGDNGTVTIWVSRLTQSRGPVDVDADSQQSSTCDIHQISYWLGDGGGLMKKDATNVGATDGSNTIPPTDGDTIAKEVTSLNFQYWDGSNWQDTWDGTVLGADGATPLGPPMAVKIELDIKHPSDPDNVKHYVRVVAIHTAGNQQPASAGGTAPSTTTGSGSTTGGGGSLP